MSTQDILIVLGPFFVLLAGMIIAFGIHYYNGVKNARKGSQ
jgi:hypothetical protein